MYQLRFINWFSPFIYDNKERPNKCPVRANNLVPHAHLRTWTSHKIAIQSGHKPFLVLVRGDDRDIFTFFPRKTLRLVLQSLRKRITANRVHKATMNLLSLFINPEQQPEKKKTLVSKRREGREGNR
jgi:hypothetical protein